MSEFRGKAGVIYTEYADTVDGYQWQAWFEDFCILGTGNSEMEALENAGRHTIDILELIVQAKVALTAVPTTAGTGD